MDSRTIVCCFLVSLTAVHVVVGGNSVKSEMPKDPDFFPVTAQFSPVPAGKGWTDQKGPLTEEILRDSVDNIIAHGFTGLEANTHRPQAEAAFILKYAQQRGMIITHHVGALELFGRDKPPKTSVYSSEYAKAVRRRAEKALTPLDNFPRLDSSEPCL